MRQTLALAGVLILLQATPALAQSQSTDPADAAVPMRLEHPGSLSARDVTGKRLLDADGAPMGTITGVSADGRTAILRPAGGGKPVDIDMSGLSLGMGSHTVTDNINSSARGLNARAAPIETPAATVPVQDPAPRSMLSGGTVTTTTTVRQSTIPGN